MSALCGSTCDPPTKFTEININTEPGVRRNLLNPWTDIDIFQSTSDIATTAAAPSFVPVSSYKTPVFVWLSYLVYGARTYGR